MAEEKRCARCNNMIAEGDTHVALPGGARKLCAVVTNIHKTQKEKDEWEKLCLSRTVVHRPTTDFVMGTPDLVDSFVSTAIAEALKEPPMPPAMEETYKSATRPPDPPAAVRVTWAQRRRRLEGRARNIWNGVLELLWWGDFPYDG